ncbi:TIGR04222 domain-containing membrane protein [Actinocrispum sp. NPDC049592]|uniref:TIGR04222 domain-containing membrane protein n=1 Tax=Actinocrispum sp. NPDC049592 TaxID=3154835 RepID=UPI003442FA23
MEDTWGISGPDFIALYLLGFLISLLFAFAVRILTRSGAVTTAAPAALSTLEVACLSGGPRRVVEAAVAQLVDTGQLRPARNGYVKVTNLQEPVNDVERAILADVRHYGHRSITMLTFGLASHDSVKAVCDRLVRAGYLIDEDKAARRKRLGMIPMGALMVVGILRWLAGIGNDRPVGWLTLMLIGTGVTFWLMRKQQFTRSTFQGATVCRSAATVTAAESVASRGLRHYPDQTVRDALLAGTVAQTAFASGGGGGAWWSSGSFGGGSSCGGGGSGCGGGGGCGG